MFSKKEIAPGILIYDNVIKDHANLHLDIEEAMSQSGVSWSNAMVAEMNQNVINPESRDTLSIGVPYHISEITEYSTSREVMMSMLSDIFLKNFKPIEDDYKLQFGINTEWHDGYGILKYGAGQKFINHVDDSPAYHRRISTVYYINEDYTGGEILFPRFEVGIKPKANQMIVFPSTYTYNHSVLPVINGERYAVVSWLK